MMLTWLELLIFAIAIWGVVTLVRSLGRSADTVDVAANDHRPAASGRRSRRRAGRWILLPIGIIVATLIIGRAGMSPVAIIVLVSAATVLLVKFIGGVHGAMRQYKHDRLECQEREQRIRNEYEPVVHARGYAPADVYPERNDSAFAAVFQAMAMIALFIVGGLFFMIPRQSTTRIVSAQSGDHLTATVTTIDGRQPARKGHTLLVSAQPIDAPPANASSTANDHPVVLAGSELHVPIAVSPTTTIESLKLPDASSAELDVIDRACTYLVMAAEKNRPVRIDDWIPARQWVARELVKESRQYKVGEGEDVKYQYQVDLDTSQKALEQLYQRYCDVRTSERTLGLMKIYGGSVLMLGGLAIFMRLGTGRKPKPPVAA